MQRLAAGLEANLEAQASAPRKTDLPALSNESDAETLVRPFSGAFLNHLAADLKERLKSLSVGIVRNLRNN